MAYTQAQLDDLESAIAQGVTSMRKDGRLVEYRSLDEMRRIRAEMRADLGVSVPESSKSRLFSVTAGKGL